MTDTSALRVQRGRIRTKERQEVARLLDLARQGDKQAIKKLKEEHGTKFERKVE